MNCSQFDLKGYFLGEVSAPERREVEVHLKACAACRDEVERLDAVRGVLAAVPQEEAPRRIAFVSDKVFEPRWWRIGWRWTFVPASALAAVMAVNMAPRPAPTPVVDVAAIESRIQTELARHLEQSEARQARTLAELMAATEKRLQYEWRADLAMVDENYDVLRKRMNRMYVATSELGGQR